MAWLWRGGAEGVGEESVAADHREENAAAMATMRELCKDLLDPDTHGASESAPANARSDDDGEREIVPAAKLEIPEEATLQRFVTGYELDAHVAAKRLRKMLKWRVSHSYGLEDTLVRDISESTPGVQHQIETGKCYILAQRDTKGRPIIVVHVRRHDPPPRRQSASCAASYWAGHDAGGGSRRPPIRQHGMLAPVKHSIIGVERWGIALGMGMGPSVAWRASIASIAAVSASIALERCIAARYRGLRVRL